MRTNISTGDRPVPSPDRPRVIVIEDNPLTVWAIKRTLSPSFDVVSFSTLGDTRADLAQHKTHTVICGSPIADQEPEEVCRLAADVGPRVVALVSSPDSVFSEQVTVLEKPFELFRLVELLGGTAEAALASRLHARFEQEICAVCVHQTASGGCSLTEKHECPLSRWALEIAEVVEGIESDRLADYMERIQSIVCPNCMQAPNGRCASRDHLDCPLDLYVGMVVPIVEDELKRAYAGLK